MLRAAVVLLLLARPLARDTEGASGAIPARFRVTIDAAGFRRASWPGEDFWDRFGGGVRREHRALWRHARPAPPPLPGRPVDLRFEKTPLVDALASLGRAAGVRIALDPAVEAAPVSIVADGLSLRDALDLVLVQASSEGAVVFDLLGDSIRVRRR